MYVFAAWQTCTLLFLFVNLWTLYQCVVVVYLAAWASCWYIVHVAQLYKSMVLYWYGITYFASVLPLFLVIKKCDACDAGLPLSPPVLVFLGLNQRCSCPEYVECERWWHHVWETFIQVGGERNDGCQVQPQPPAGCPHFGCQLATATLLVFCSSLHFCCFHKYLP